MRPNDNNVDVFSKIKQPIYHKSLAFNKYHKKRIDGQCFPEETKQ